MSTITLNLPQFNSIQPEAIEPLVSAILAKNRKLLNQLLHQDSFSWQTLLQPLEDADLELSNTWNIISHLNNVMSTSAIRAAYHQCLPNIVDYHTELSQNNELYQAIHHIYQNQSFKELEQAQQKVIKNALRDFHLSGVTLPEQEKQRFKAIQKRLAELSTKFEENLLDATDAWSYTITDEKMLAGLPEYAKARAKKSAEEKHLKGWLLTLDPPSYQTAITYLDDRNLRQTIYTAYVTRASDLGSQPDRWDNSGIMLEIVTLRHELALLLGYKNYAQVSLAAKMAKDTHQVLNFLNELANKSYSAAQKEFQELSAFASKRDNIKHLQPWDIAYYSEKFRNHLFNFSEEQLRPYFSENNVLQGLFNIAKQLYGIEIKEQENIAERWHPDVRFFKVYNEQAELIAGFYMDLYARKQKRGGAWMDECRDRHRNQAGQLQLPITFVNCNFSPPTNHTSSLLTHEEVQTLFHEFGHALHHMLTKMEIISISGIHGVNWDAVELPSQFMENWCWNKESLLLFAKHYQTEEKLPDELITKLIESKNFQAAMDMMRQLEFSLFDFRLHLEFDPQKENQIQTILDEVRQQVTVIPVVPFNRFQHGFAHIFAADYAAGYYSYKWAEVLSCDAFSAFKQKGIFNPDLGAKFRDEILAQGGAREAMDLFIAFMGREPKIDALLEQSGIRGS